MGFLDMRPPLGPPSGGGGGLGCSGSTCAPSPSETLPALGLLDFVKGVGWSEEQGRRSEMEDGMIVIRGYGGQRGAWLLGVYDGHGGRQTVDFLLQHLHTNIWKEVVSKAFRRRDALLQTGQWEQLFAGSLGALGRALPSPLAFCSEEDIEAALVAAFRTTDELLLRSGVNESGSTACVCLIHPKLSLPPLSSAVSPEDTPTLASSPESPSTTLAPNSSSSSSSKVPPGPSLSLEIHAAHLGDTRVLLVYSDSSCRRLTHPSDHKASAPRETERVETIGGFVIGERVNGMLAIGRAFGDWSLKLGPLASPALLQKGRQLIVSNLPDVQTETIVPKLQQQKQTRLLSAAEAAAGADSAAAAAGGSSSGPRFVSEQQQKEPALLLLACDGLFDVIDDAGAAAFALGVVRAVAAASPAAAASEAAEAAAKALVHEAVALRMSGDNVSVIVCVLQTMEQLAAAAAPTAATELPVHLRSNTPHRQLSPNSSGGHTSTTPRGCDAAAGLWQRMGSPGVRQCAVDIPHAFAAAPAAAAAAAAEEQQEEEISEPCSSLSEPSEADSAAAACSSNSRNITRYSEEDDCRCSSPTGSSTSSRSRASSTVSLGRDGCLSTLTTDADAHEAPPSNDGRASKDHMHAAAATPPAATPPAAATPSAAANSATGVEQQEMLLRLLQQQQPLCELPVSLNEDELLLSLQAHQKQLQQQYLSQTQQHRAAAAAAAAAAGDKQQPVAPSRGPLMRPPTPQGKAFYERPACYGAAAPWIASVQQQQQQKQHDLLLQQQQQQQQLLLLQGGDVLWAVPEKAGVASASVALPQRRGAPKASAGRRLSPTP